MNAGEVYDGARLDMRLKDTDSWTGPMRHCEYRLRPEAQEPLPCPHCGATFWTKDGMWLTQHRDDCFYEQTHQLPQGAVAAWNRRAPAPATEPATDREALSGLCRELDTVRAHIEVFLHPRSGMAVP